MVIRIPPTESLPTVDVPAPVAERVRQAAEQAGQTPEAWLIDAVHRKLRSQT